MYSCGYNSRLPRTRTKIHIFQRSQLSPKGICLLSYFSRYLCLFVFIRGFPYPLFSFLSLAWPIEDPVFAGNDQVSISNKKGLLNVCSPKSEKGCGLNARSPEWFFEESGYPLLFRTTGCPAAAAAAAPIARRILKVLEWEVDIMDFLSIFWSV